MRLSKKKKLGFVPLQSDGYFYEDTLENWGLDPEKEIKKSVKVANGILIPWFEGSILWRLGIKRPGETRSYGQVTGSGEGLYGVSSIQYDTPAMIVESEFCQASVEQEASDLIACVATGSTTRGRLNKWIAELGLPVAEKNGFVLQSFDEDESGDIGAEYWIQNLKRCIRWSPLVAKDPNDILRGKFLPDTEERHYSGYTLREWVEAGIHIARVEFGLSRPFVLPPSGGIESTPSIPLARGEVLIKRVPLIEQGIREYGGKLLSREQAMNRTGQPIKPDFPCFFCNNHSRKKKFWAWTWSPLDGECICVECLSPANWSQRNMASSTDSNNKTWHK